MKLQIRLSHARTVLVLLLAVLGYSGAWAEELGGYNFDTEGEGADKVYLIKTETDLENLAAYVNAGNNCLGLTFKLNTNITMTGAHTPIGGRVNNISRYFRGTFDGNKMTITNLTINQPEVDNQGLFGSIWSAVVKDLTLVDCHITARSCVGGIAGIAYGDENAHSTIENCHVVNGGIASTETGADSHGGIIGNAYQYTDISLCSVSGTISTKENNSKYGGIVGYMSNSSVTACENTANITGSGQYHGGITGITLQTSSVSLCFNTGTIEGSSSVGAIIGNHSTKSSCSDCYYAPPCNVKGIGSDGPESDSDVAGQAERVYTITASGHVTDIAIAEDATVASKSGQKYYKAGNWTATLTLGENYNFINYVCEGGMLADVDVAAGGHTLTISNADVTVSALASISTATDIAGATIAPIGDKRWKGYAGVTPALYVTYNSTPLVEGTDYVVTYTNNTTIGNATATLTGINNYAGTKAATFNIVDLQLQDPTADNSAGNPYLISTEEDLEALAGIVNSGARTGGYYKQTITIDCYSEHTAIGTANNYFCGNYDGDNKPIRFLTINKPGEGDQGLFGYIRNAAIQKVVLVDCDITGGFHTGGIAGYMLCDGKKIEKCTVSGVIKSDTGNPGDAHGGIVGYLCKGTIDQCVNTASVTGNGSLFGGIAGHSDGYLTNNFNAGTVEGVGNVGSIVGRNSWGTLTNNYHTAATTGGVGEYHVAIGTDQEGAETAVVIALRNGVTMVSEPVGEVYGKKYYAPTVTLNWSLPVDAEFVNYTVNSGEISNPTIMTGEHTLTGFTGDVVISAVCNMPAVTYLDMNGEEQTVTDYALLTGSESNLLDAGWYVVDGTLNYSHGFSFKGDVHFILKDGAKLNIGTEQNSVSGVGFGCSGQYNSSINVYGQSTGNNNGQLNIYSTGSPVWAYNGNFNCSSARLMLKTTGNYALLANFYNVDGTGNITLKDATVNVTNNAPSIYANGGNVTINGGEVNATTYAPAIFSTKNSGGTGGDVTVNGGKVTATGYPGISAQGDFTLGWTRPSDFILASSYSTNGHITLTKDFVTEDGTVYNSGTYASSQLSAIAGKKLQPYVEGGVVYLDADGQSHFCTEYIELNSEKTSLAAGWYVADGTLDYTSGLFISGDVNIILKDGATVNVSNINGGSSLSIFGQENGTGALNVTNSLTSDNITINGGCVTAFDMTATGDITLNWTAYSNFVRADNYTGNVVLAKDLIDENNTVHTAANVGSIACKILYPYIEGSIAYLDMDGNRTICTNYTTLTGSEQNSLDAGWYVVDGTLNYDHGLSFKGDVHFILKDGAKLNIGTEQSAVSGYGFGNTTAQYNFSVSVYGQSTGDNNGQLNIYSSSNPVRVYNGNFSCSSARLTLKCSNACALWAEKYNVDGTGNIIFKDAVVSATSTSSYAIYAERGNVTINGGEVNAMSTSSYAIYADRGNVTVNGGEVNATSTSEDAIYAYDNNSNGGNITINGGQVTAIGKKCGLKALNGNPNNNGQGGDITINGGIVTASGTNDSGMSANYYYYDSKAEEVIEELRTITIGWTSADDRITASSYDGNVVIANGQAFVNGSDIYAGTLSAAEKSAIAGLTLQPYAQETIVMNASGIRTYASPYNLDFTDIEGLTAYTVAAVNNNTLTLTPVNKAPAGTGLLLKGTADANFNVPTTASAAAIAGNYLVGVLSGETVVQKTETVESIDYTNFILANGSYGIDWYTLSQNGAIGANKAYLRLPTDALSNGARLTMEFGDATGVGEMRNEKGEMRNGAWYTVNGVKLSGKPTRKGLYIFNGKKTVVK